jgi:HK97 family phage portal protein
MDEPGALGLSAFYRAVSLISGTLASLPFRTHSGDDAKVVPSIFDNPDTDEGQTPFEWKETAFLHLLLHGRTGAIKLRNPGGALARLALVHPLSWSVEKPTGDERPAGGLWFRVNLKGGEQKRYDADGFWYVPGLSMNGTDTLSLIDLARQSLSTAAAGDAAAGNMFANGALISGLATPADDDDITSDIPEMRRQLNNATGGHENAGQIAIVNRRLTFTPWTMTATDAQFLQSRQFQIEEIARWTGVPPHLLMQTEKQTSWGTGVDEQNRGLSRFVLGHWAQRFEQRASRLLPRPRWVEFDFAGLERPNFATEVELLMKQTGGKPILTVNEARAIRNLPPVPGGNVLETPAAPPAQPAPVPDEEGDDA